MHLCIRYCGMMLLIISAVIISASAVVIHYTKRRYIKCMHLYLYLARPFHSNVANSELRPILHRLPSFFLFLFIL